MPSLSHIKQRLSQLQQLTQEPLIHQIIQQLEFQQYRAEFSSEQIKQWCECFQLSPIELGLKCLPVAAAYSLAPISNFYVGAVAIGQSGNFYFGANQEYQGVGIQQTVHAEQSAIMHAWHCNEKALTDIVVNYTPCGHCRQFINELNTASEIQIHLPHSQHNPLHSYLPDAFGPKDLNISQPLFDAQSHHFEIKGSELEQQAIRALNQSYAPYSQALSAVAIQLGNQIICGRYAENAAFNPSMPALQSALNQYRLYGLSDKPIEKILLVEKKSNISQKQMCASLCFELFNIELDYLLVY